MATYKRFVEPGQRKTNYEEQERFAEFGRWSAGLLHDLANPLTAAQLSLEQWEVEKRQELVDQTADSLRHMERYIEAARQRLQRPSPAIPFMVSEEIGNAIRVLTPMADNVGVHIERTIAEGSLLLGDPIRFNQLVLNVVANAIDAYQPVTRDAKRCIRISVTRERKGLRLVAEDWGSGIPADHKLAVFKPFYTTKPRAHNAGLGLSLVKQIVEDEFGGSIDLHTAEGRGTRVTIWLPGHQPKG